MSEPYLGEIKIFGFSFAPRDWALCDGQLLPINQNQSLYSLLGTTFGGDGETTFGLPELRGRSAIHKDGSHPWGDKAGAESVALTMAEIPTHTHTLIGSADAATGPVPTGKVLADSAPNELYHAPTNLVPVHANTVAQTGNSAGHNNMQPYVTVSFCIALRGLFPSRN